MAIDGLPLAGKTTLADRLAEAIGGACISLDDFIKPERDWRWRGPCSFPFDYIRYDEFVGAVEGRWRRTASAGIALGTTVPASGWILTAWYAWMSR